MAKRRIVISEGVRCPDCGSTELRGRGSYWRSNPHGDNPPRIKIRQLLCNNCGRIFADGEVKNNGES